MIVAQKKCVLSLALSVEVVNFKIRRDRLHHSVLDVFKLKVNLFQSLGGIRLSSHAACFI